MPAPTRLNFLEALTESLDFMNRVSFINGRHYWVLADKTGTELWSWSDGFYLVYEVVADRLILVHRNFPHSDSIKELSWDITSDTLLAILACRRLTGEWP